jgi:hypothetical protein
MHAADARLAYAYVRRFELRLRAPDALHLAIARHLDVSLVTLDRRMAAAARELGIAVEMPKRARPSANSEPLAPRRQGYDIHADIDV